MKKQLIFVALLVISDIFSQEIVSFTVEELDGISTQNYPIMVSHIFRKGDVPENVTAVISGNNIPTQTDVKVRWDDGSVRHALVSFLIPNLDANSLLPVTLINGGTNNSTSKIEKDQIFGANTDCITSFSFNGNTASYSSKEILNNANYDETLWLKGNICTEYIADDLREPIQRTYANQSLSVAPQDQIRVIYNIRKFSGWNGVRVFLTVENCWANLIGNVVYDVSVTDGQALPNVLYSKQNVDHTASARWGKEFWIGEKPSRINIIYNIQYLFDTGMLPNYNLDISYSFKDNIQETYDRFLNKDIDILGSGSITKYFPTTGGRDDIGLFPSWTAKYLVLNDWRLRDIMLTNAFMSGSIPTHYREGENTKSFYKHIVSIDDRPTIITDRVDFKYTRDNDKLPPFLSEVRNDDWHTDCAHQPSLVYVPYLITGEHYFLEELIFWAGRNLSSRNYDMDWGRKESQGIIEDQVRGVAWALRNMADAAVIIPDGFIEKNYLNEKIQNNISFFEEEYISNTFHPVMNIWGTVSNRGDDGGRPDNNLDPKVRYFSSPWMEDFLLMSFIHLNELGYPTQNLVSYLGKYLIDRYTNTSFNPFLGNSYHIPTHFTETANELQPYFPYESWRDVLNSFIPEVRNKNDFTEDDLYADSYLNISRGCINSLKNYQIEGNQAAYNFLFSVCDSIVNASSYSRNSLLKDPKWEFTPRINSVINVEEDISNRINHFSLEQNYPNPFNPSTMINYQLSMNSNVTLKIYDILGREVATLVNEHKPAGTYTVEWNGTNSAGQQVGSGVYFYQLKTSGGFVETKKMLMIK